MKKLLSPQFGSKKEAFSSFFSWFTAPTFFLGMGVYAVVKLSNLYQIPFETSKQTVFLIVVLFIGILIYSWYKAFQALRAINSTEFEKLGESETVMCVKCLEPLHREDTNGMVCNRCGGPLEDLAGFYDRHPELR